jgi:hypothetical protein
MDLPPGYIHDGIELSDDGLLELRPSSPLTLLSDLIKLQANQHGDGDDGANRTNTEIERERSGSRQLRTNISSCHICYHHKVRCNGSRPCQRCIRLDRINECYDRIKGDDVAKPRTIRRKTSVVTRPSRYQSLPPPTAPPPTVPIRSSSASPTPTLSLSESECIVDAALPPSTSNGITTLSENGYVSGMKHARSSSSTTSPSISTHVDGDGDSSPSLTTTIIGALPQSPHSSPRRKRDRRIEPVEHMLTLSNGSRPRDHITSTFDCLLDMLATPFAFTSSSSSSSSSSSPSPSSSTSSSYDSWMKTATTPSPNSVLRLKYDETMIVRSGLLHMRPWFVTLVDQAGYRILDQLDALWEKMKRYLIYQQICPNCQSPSKKCLTCQIASSEQQTKLLATKITVSSFCDWTLSLTWSSMWNQRATYFVESSLFNTIGIAGMCWTSDGMLSIKHLFFISLIMMR